jgi:hypothetical protein
MIKFPRLSRIICNDAGIENKPRFLPLEQKQLLNLKLSKAEVSGAVQR